MRFLPALFTLSLSLAANAFAQSSSAGSSRADVRARLVWAESQGLIQSSKTDYPPSGRTIARNRALYSVQHPDVVSNTDSSFSAGQTQSVTSAGD